MPKPELKPCPHCGMADPEELGFFVDTNGDELVYGVACSCGAMGPDAASEKEAAEKWNKRAPVDGSNAAKLRAALEDMIRHDDRFTGCDAFQFRHKSCNGKTTAGECHFKLHCDRVFRAMAILEEPARNCDRYADEDDAFAAWHDSLKDGDVVRVREAFKWLFAQAREGGSNAGA